MKTLQSEAYSVLAEMGYNEQCYPLDALLSTVEMNSMLAEAKVKFYKWSGAIVLTLIPIVSALVSVAVGLNEGTDLTWLESGLHSSTFELSLLLTIFTILNSLLKPRERFHHACTLGIQIEAFKADFLTALERLKMKKEKVDEQTLLDLVEKKRKQFERYQEELIRMFLPMEIPIRQGAGRRSDQTE